MRILIAAWLVIVFSAGAQSVLVTNLVTAAPSFREVDGKLYNTQKSVLWEQKQSKVVQVEADHLIVDTYQEQVIYETTQRQVWANELKALGAPTNGPAFSSLDKKQSVTNQINWQKVVLKNWTNPNKLAVGQKLDFLAIKTGMTNTTYGDLEVWDCGVPHVVSVVRTNNVK